MSTSLLTNPGSRITERFTILRLRDLRFVFSATVASSFGDGIVSVALAFAVLDLTGSATDLGVVMAARMAASIAVTLIGGAVSDRISRRTVMITADLVRFAGQSAIGVLLVTGHASVFEIAISQVLLGAATSFFWPASSGLIQSVAGELVQEANALKAIVGSGAVMLGPAIGGVLVVGIGASWALVFDGSSYLISALLLSRVTRDALAAMERDRKPSTFLADLRGGLHEVTSRTWLWVVIVVMSAGNLLYASYPVLVPLICKQRYGGASAYAAISVMWAAGMLVGGSALLRFKPRYLLRAAAVAFLPAMLPGVLLGLHAPIYVIGLSQFLSGIGMTVTNALLVTAMQQNVPRQAMSRVSSYVYAGSLSVMPIGFALAGPLAAAIGDSTALVVCCATAVLVNMVDFLVKDVRNLQATAAPGY